jgi:hypothetical protein
MDTPTNIVPAAVSDLLGGAVFLNLGEYWALGAAIAPDGTRLAFRLRDGAEVRVGPATVVGHAVNAQLEVL